MSRNGGTGERKKGNRNYSNELTAPLRLLSIEVKDKAAIYKFKYIYVEEFFSTEENRLA